MESKFTWVGFYIELADKILAFKDNRASLVEKVREAHKIAGKDLPKVESDNSNIPDIDPFTVIALFNRGKQSPESRIALCSGYKSAFGISAAVPSDFDGIPMYTYNQYCFYRFVGDSKRNDNCFSILWNLFESAIKYADDNSNEDSFKTYFEEALKLDLIGLPKLTIGLFQIRPNSFINLDSVNKPLIEKRTNATISISSGEDYIKLCNKVFEHIHASSDCNTLPEFSSLAYDKKTQDKTAPKDEWFPSLEEYDPSISKEQWIDFMKNSGLFNDNYKDFLTKMLNEGGQATCAQLADKYGNTVAHYNMTATHLAEHVVEYTHCALRKDEEGKDRYWTVLFVGKNATVEEKGGFVWKLRNELKEALETMDFENTEEKKTQETQLNISKNMILYGPPKMDPRKWTPPNLGGPCKQTGKFGGRPW